MKIRVCYCVIIFTIIIVPAFGQKFKDSFSVIVERLMKEYKIHGAAVAVVSDKDVIWSEGFGYTDNTQLHKVDVNTLFSVQSVTKIFTGTVALMQMSKGLLELDAPVIHYLPSLKLRSRFGNDEYKKITVRHLLSHHAGLLQEAPEGNNYDTTYVSFPKHIQSINNSWLKLPVGKFYSYSNIGMDLVGAILLRKTNESFGELMKRKLLSPLEMNRSTFDQQAVFRDKNYAEGFFNDKQALHIYIPNLCGGGLYSSVNDMSRFILFQLNDCVFPDGSTAISKQFIGERNKIQFAVENQTAGYGLALRIRSTPDGKVLYHSGGGYGYRSELLWMPEHKIGIVLLSNDGAGSAFSSIVTSSILNKLLEMKGVKRNNELKMAEINYPKPSPGSEQTYSAEKLNQYCQILCGKYRGYNNGQPVDIEILIKNGALISTFGGEIQISYYRPNLYFASDGEAIEVGKYMIRLGNRKFFKIK